MIIFEPYVMMKSVKMERPVLCWRSVDNVMNIHVNVHRALMADTVRPTLMNAHLCHAPVEQPAMTRLMGTVVSALPGMKVSMVPCNSVLKKLEFSKKWGEGAPVLWKMAGGGFVFRTTRCKEVGIAHVDISYVRFWQTLHESSPFLLLTVTLTHVSTYQDCHAYYCEGSKQYWFSFVCLSHTNL